MFRAQCDGPGKEWLSLPESYVPGTDLQHVDLVAAPTAERAGNWPGERAARTAARNAGWDTPGFSGPVFCPACRLNPLGIYLPKPCQTCTHVHRGPVCGHTMVGYPCMCMNEVTT